MFILSKSIYQIIVLEDNEYIALARIGDMLIGDFILEKYKVTSYLDVFWKAYQGIKNAR